MSAPKHTPEVIARLERSTWDGRVLPSKQDVRALLDSHAGLLAALKLVTVELAQCRCHRRLTVSEEIALDAARDAIAKATGQ